jgi:hypothetical protein
MFYGSVDTDWIFTGNNWNEEQNSVLVFFHWHADTCIFVCRRDICWNSRVKKYVGVYVYESIIMVTTEQLGLRRSGHVFLIVFWCHQTWLTVNFSLFSPSHVSGERRVKGEGTRRESSFSRNTSPFVYQNVLEKARVSGEKEFRNYYLIRLSDSVFRQRKDRVEMERAGIIICSGSG